MGDTLIRTTPDDPRAQRLLQSLDAEYAQRYGEFRSTTASNGPSEVNRYPPQAFVPPLGDFLLLIRDGQVIAGGAYMSHDDETVEIKRVWTDSAWRRQGLSRIVMAALEESAVRQGYTRAYLSTGFRQPEAFALYVSLGYRPLFDTTVDLALFRSLPFEKHIGRRAGPLAETPWREVSSTLEAATQLVARIKDEQEKKILARVARHRQA
ncbi:acetyltransferase (GNAT) family protein [Comamonas sp. BIGb0124]|uniref:GNAT family N-acetyltransferase n=1 Tax=Comamonas sp. BIGb0124 TaxID=2485130 RepID=UPI000F4815E3|nr:GNAT family N-acetyltransferase [Comamonas sp. BIGb0124]ROR22917.1 acetyltransferase (GNAT) family protein [Comamonas sp. BIGb0124]